MKRKFFSMMVAACAALFSFTGLTGCSGGGGDDATYGVITLKEFETGAKYFRIALGSKYVDIVPTSGMGSSAQIPGSNIELQDPRQTGSRLVDCMVGDAKASVRYELYQWADDSDYPADGDANTPNSNRLIIYFDATDNNADDTALLKAFGLDAPLERLGSNINIGLSFANGTCSASYTAYYTSDGVPVTIVKNPTGSLVVMKR